MLRNFFTLYYILKVLRGLSAASPSPVWAVGA
jgi:hypothetical protein